MRYNELEAILTSTAADDWVKLDTWGPTYRDWARTEPATGMEDRRTASTAVLSHSYLAVYRDDIDLTLAWGLDADEDPFTFEKEREKNFGTTFADPRVDVEIVDVFWRGALVYREHFLDVDGSRAYLPFPRFKTITADGAEAKGVVDTVSAKDLPLIRAIDTLAGNERTDEYLNMTGWVID